MEKAMTTLEFLSQDQKTRMLYEARQKALHDYASAIGHAEERGMEKGKLEGRLEVARRMLTKGVSLEEAADLTDLSMEELAALQRTMQQ